MDVSAGRNLLSKLSRDRKRAESYRAKKIKASDIILPFSSNLLQVKEVSDTCPTAVTDDMHGSVEVSTTPEAIPLQNLPSTPIKNIPKFELPSVDVLTARKDLFPVEAEAQQIEIKKANPVPLYQKKEERMWSSIFNG